MERALGDLKVVDLTHYMAGPYCTKLLADFGADVIKVEPPGRGDGARRVGPFPRDEPDPEKSALFLHLNTSKRGVTLNLKSGEGIRILKDLVQDADVVVENFEPRVMPSLGLSYDELSSVNPKLVLTSISNFGQTGPYRDFAATELTLFAMGGQMASLGVPDREPYYFGGAITQYFAGTMAALATLAAVLRARTNNEGEHIDTSILECWLGTGASIANLTRYSYTGEPQPRAAQTEQIHPTSDGFVHFTAAGAGAGGARGWRRLVRLLGMPELLEDERFATFSSRQEHAGEILALVLPWLVERTKYEVTESAQEKGVFAVPVLAVDEVVNDAHNRDREFFVQVDHPARDH